MPSLLIATRNPGKLREMRALLECLGIDLPDPTSLGLHQRLQELRDDYAANARLKAGTFARLAGLWALGDDTGLEMEALGGAPGPISARLVEGAREGATDADRRRALLRLLQPHPRPWTARFRCTAALASPQGQFDLAEGVCEGEIIAVERGQEGFGYDPIFLIQGTQCTMAELPLAQKNRLSHRARAIQTLLPTIRLRLGLE
jgi:XTP/dITP diphosphohydrolase